MFIKQLKIKIKKETMSIKTKYSPPVSVVFCAHKAVVFAMGHGGKRLCGPGFKPHAGDRMKRKWCVHGGGHSQHG